MSRIPPTDWQWFPSEYVSWHEVSLPATRQWKKLLGYALEERLATPLDKVMLVPLSDERSSAGDYSVLVVDKVHWFDWLQEQQARGRPQVAVCPDVLALPYIPEEVCALVEGERVRLRWGQWQGAAGRLSDMTLVLQALKAQASNWTLRCYGDKIPEAWLLQDWQTIHHSLKLFHPVLPSVDIRQAHLKPYFSWQSLGEWQGVLALVVLCLSLGLGQQTWLLLEKDQQQARYYQQSQQLFTQHFPDIKRRVNLVTQAKSALKQTHQPSISLIDLMASLSTLLMTLSPVDALLWRDQQLVLRWASDQNLQTEPQSLPVGWQWTWRSEREAVLSNVAQRSNP